MKIPTDISGQELIVLLRKHYGYEKTRQVGSHVRITTQSNGEHHLTIPNHDPLKIGTLNGIIKDVAEHFNLTKETVLKVLFG